MLQRMFQIKTLGAAVAGILVLLSALATAQDDPAIETGKVIATQGVGGVPSCASCHGQGGEGMIAAGFPALAGMDAAYFERQLADMKTGSRGLNPAMKPVVDGLTPDQIKAVAKYYESLELKVTPGDPTLAAKGKLLVEVGDWDRGLPACVSCHGPDGLGVNHNFPAIAGQGAPYLAAQVNAWKQGTRKNDVNGLMASVANKLTDEDVAAIGAYLQGVSTSGSQEGK